MTRPMALLKRWRLAAALLVAATLLGSYPMVSADPVAPAPRDRQIALTVSWILQKEHLSKHAFDDEIAHRALTQFLRALDPMKLYFYQSDVDGFMERKDDVLKVKQGDVALAYDIFKTYLQRIDERVQTVDELLTQQFDFTRDEEIVTDRDALEYPKNQAEAQDRWRKRIKYDLLLLQADRIDEKNGNGKKKPSANAEPEKSPEEQAKADIDRLKKRYHTIASQRHQIDSDELLEYYLTSLSNAFDPHSSYMSPTTEENFRIQMALQLEGIGAALRQQDGETTVERLVPGGPAEKGKELKVGDKIVGVGQGVDGQIQDVVEMKLDQVVKQIRGKRGTIVRLEVLSGKEKKTIQITRDRVEMKDSEARAKVFEAGRKPDGTPYKIGVLDLPSFYMDMAGARNGQADYKNATSDVRKILEQFNRQGVDSLVLDLRRNGGGSLPEAISLTGLFIDEGPMVQVKNPDGRVTPHRDDDGGTAVWKKPMIVLISRFSASASEILAGAIQDYKRGLIVGDHSSHGKGTVQSLNDLAELLWGNRYGNKLGSLKITMQQFYRPNGDSTQLRGVLSDIEIPSLTTHYEGISESDLDYAVPFDQIAPQKFRAYDMVDKPLIERLKQASTTRVGQSSDFQQVLKRIARYQDMKERKRVTLNAEKYLAERAEWNADQEEEKKFEEMQEDGNGEIKRDYYLDEALAISVDYLGALRQPSGAPVQAVQAAK